MLGTYLPRRCCKLLCLLLPFTKQSQSKYPQMNVRGACKLSRKHEIRTWVDSLGLSSGNGNDSYLPFATAAHWPKTLLCICKSLISCIEQIYNHPNGIYTAHLLLSRKMELSLRETKVIHRI